MPLNHYQQAVHIAQAYADHTFSIHDVEVLVTELDELTLVSVRGTELGDDISWWDIIRDLRFLPISMNRMGLGHAGMQWGAKLVARRLNQLLTKDKPLYFGGHSLGAGVSFLALAVLEQYGFTIHRWMGLGTPRVQFLPQERPLTTVEMVAYRYGRDIVTYLPFRIMGYGLSVEEKPLGTPSHWYPNSADHNVERYLTALAGAQS